jgi:starch-binding outer membrane protein, SusD/RagB family
MNTLPKICYILFLIPMLWSCDGFLDPKPDQSLLVPTTLDDMQALLDNNVVMNSHGNLSSISSGEFWMSNEGYAGTASLTVRAAYIWSEDLYPDGSSQDWNVPYQMVFYSNVVLEALEKFTGERGARYNHIKGAALFFRAFAYYQLLQEFAPPFQVGGGNESLPGIVLRSDPDVNLPSLRSNLSDSYAQVIADLSEAREVLPDFVEFKTRPSKAAANSLLARVYLFTFEFAKAVEASELALTQYTDRLDFNRINVNLARPFVRFNEETIFYSQVLSVPFFSSNLTFVDSVLMKAYPVGDLRIPAYFDPRPGGRFSMTGHHSNSVQLFGGMSVGENQLIAAESHARLGNVTEALSHLHALRRNRIATARFSPIAVTDQGQLLNLILEERRRELIGRGLRWSDLRRLNQENGRAENLVRRVEDREYTLLPNSTSYVFPIPTQEIIRSGIPQNVR